MTKIGIKLTQGFIEQPKREHTVRHRDRKTLQELGKFKASLLPSLWSSFSSSLSSSLSSLLSTASNPLHSENVSGIFYCRYKMRNNAESPVWNIWEMKCSKFEKSKFMAINMPQGQRREKEILLLLDVAQIAPTLQFRHLSPFFLDNY